MESFFKIEEDSVFYSDLTPPIIQPIRSHINSGGNVDLRVNVTDNVGVSNAWGFIESPSGENTSINFSYSDGLYINNSVRLVLPGEYIVYYYAIDYSSNENLTTDWFEVYDRYYWNVGMRDVEENPVIGADIKLFRPSTSTLLLSNTTNNSGGASIYANKRFYDLFSSYQNNSIILFGANFSVTNLSF
jgi:hypothetical protein